LFDRTLRLNEGHGCSGGWVVSLYTQIQARFLGRGSLLQAGFPCTSKVKLRLQRWDRVHDFQREHIIVG
jgi:hypothetical protein